LHFRAVNSGMPEVLPSSCRTLEDRHRRDRLGDARNLHLVRGRGAALVARAEAEFEKLRGIAVLIL
jgi:hypothetical protein